MTVTVTAAVVAVVLAVLATDAVLAAGAERSAPVRGADLGPHRHAVTLATSIPVTQPPSPASAPATATSLQNGWLVSATDLGTLGGSMTSPVDMNRAGLITGTSTDAAGVLHPFTWTPTQGLRTLPSAAADFSPNAVNDRGTIAGQDSLQRPPGNAAVWDGSRLRQPMPPGHDHSIASIDEKDTAYVHTYRFFDRVTQLTTGCMRVGAGGTGRLTRLRVPTGRATCLGTTPSGTVLARSSSVPARGPGFLIPPAGARTRLPAALGEPLSITRRGDVIGCAGGTDSGNRAQPATTLVRPGSHAVATLHAPKGVRSDGLEVWDGNRGGDLVGDTWDRASGRRVAVVWTAGATAQALPGLGGSSRATSINERGDIAGTSLTAAGTPHAVMWRHRRLIDLGAAIGADQPSVAREISPTGRVMGVRLVNHQTRAMTWTVRTPGKATPRPAPATAPVPTPAATPSAGVLSLLNPRETDQPRCAS